MSGAPALGTSLEVGTRMVAASVLGTKIACYTSAVEVYQDILYDDDEQHCFSGLFQD